MKSDSGEMMTLTSQGSISEDACSGGGGMLKKGPWTTAEDAILVDYVTKHGEGNWNAVQKHSGLARCGKSCRLRWANHLRPDLKKGSFTLEEENHIIHLHSKMGNKWARMAAELPGRTDNEIKNYWNTRLKRRQRAGLPVYPPDICLKSFNESKQSKDFGTFSQHPNLSQNNSFEIPTVEFKSFELNPMLYSQELLDDTQGGLISSSSPYGNSRPLLSVIHPSKRIRGSQSLFPGLSANDSAIPYQNENDFVQMAQSCFGLSYAYQNRNLDGTHGSHALLNGTTSSPSDPTWGKKIELPSFQSQMDSWGSPSSPPPSMQSVDTLIHSPPRTTEQQRNNTTGSGGSNSGLLDAVLYESHTKCNLPSGGGFLMMSGDMGDDLHDPDMETYGDPISPLGHSAASVFSGRSSLDEPHSVEMMSDCFSAKDVFETGMLEDLSRNCKNMGASATSTRQGCVWDAMSTF
ncbi:hypothetical protein DM860_006090 [Cuscuta australis]|uniref:Transcription factor n=1 Tax=Cuscuta australis TaxID=267555 RepID=A0A328DKF6_9ASTE|nr:hypothetical protein DM860_006090 [Cuscuta australis]